MTTFPWLTTLMLVPLVGSIVVALLPSGRGTLPRRLERGDPLLEDTVMYGASLTKAAFGYLVMQLVEEGRLGRDVPIARYLPQPLPSCASPENA